ARLLGQTPNPGQFVTSCEPAGVCSLVVMGEFPAQDSGTMRCDAQGRFEFVDSVDGTSFSFEPFNGYLSRACPVIPTKVTATTVVASGDYAVHAFDASGTPISIAAGGDGKLYMGVFAPKAGCPCFPHD
ncbi:MAG: hypothetical protein ACRDG3_03665, partial [Tepidiformaceae bacterium]